MTQIHSIEIRDIVLCGDQLYGIEKDGKPIKWNLKNNSPENLVYDTLIKFTSIAVGGNSNIILGTNTWRTL